VRAVELAGALADPQEVRGQVVQLRARRPGVQPQQRALVVEQQRLVAGVDLDGVQRRVVDAAGRHEPQAAVDLVGQRLVALAGRRVARRSPCSSRAPVQVGHAGAGQRADEVHRRARVGVGADHPARVGDAASGVASSELTMSPR
jgi:hypothetical protein